MSAPNIGAAFLRMREFFGFGGYSRPVEGYFSWQHLLFVTLLMAAMVACAVILGRSRKNLDAKRRNRVLVVTAFLIDGVELFKIVVLCIRHEDPMYWVNVLPLFLCSIQLITIPLAAFSSGKVKEAALDFVTIFGLLGAVLGTYLAGNNYAAYPVISMDNVFSGITHCLAGFAALYIMISGMADLKKRNIPLTMGILAGFGIAAYIANIFTDCNYMFLSRGDGTPYDILFALVGGHSVLYPVGVMALFALYIAVFYGIYFRISRKKVSIA